MYTLHLLRDNTPITPHDIHNFSERTAVELELNVVYEAVSHLTCPTHNLGVQVTGTVLDGGKVNLAARACCGDFRAEAQEHLAHLPVQWE